jgi:hypothetical protein
LTKFNEQGGVSGHCLPKNIRRTWPIVRLRANFLSLAARNVARIKFELIASEKFVKFEIWPPSNVIGRLIESGGKTESKGRRHFAASLINWEASGEHLTRVLSFH